MHACFKLIELGQFLEALLYCPCIVFRRLNENETEKLTTQLK